MPVPSDNSGVVYLSYAWVDDKPKVLYAGYYFASAERVLRENNQHGDAWIEIWQNGEIINTQRFL